MKRLLTILLLVVSMNTFAQVRRVHKDFAIEFSGSYLELDGFQSRPTGGFALSYYLGKRVSVDSRFAISDNYLHFSPSIITAPLFIYTEAYKDMNFYFTSSLFYNLLLFASSVENLSFHFPFHDKADIAPYISLLSFKAIRDPGNPNPGSTIFSELKPTGTVGLKMNVYVTERVYVAPYAEVMLQYSANGTWGTNFGGSIGILFPKGGSVDRSEEDTE